MTLIKYSKGLSRALKLLLTPALLGCLSVHFIDAQLKRYNKPKADQSEGGADAGKAPAAPTDLNADIWTNTLEMSWASLPVGQRISHQPSPTSPPGMEPVSGGKWPVMEPTVTVVLSPGPLGNELRPLWAPLSVTSDGTSHKSPKQINCNICSMR